MDLVERFINYTKFDTQSSEDSESVPSTAKQLEFAKYLKHELEEEGLSDVEMDDMGYIYATLKGNTKKKTPTIGFISHMDTSPDASGKDIKARVIENYDGEDIELSPGIISSVEKFPELKAHKGEDIIVTDGTTLLGADDKAGIAEIVQAMCYLRDHKEIKHGDIRVGFNPDEEIGMGAHHFDVEKFGCDWAYTIDGGDLGHLLGIESRCEEAKLSYIIRDHDRQKFEARKDFIEDCVKKMNEKYGEGTVTAEIYDQYYNMKEKIDPNMHVIDIVLRAMQESGVPPRVEPIRGGTDGAQLSFKGLPCPNIFAGGVNFHGPHEFVSVQVMQKVVDTIVKIAEITEEYND